MATTYTINYTGPDGTMREAEGTLPELADALLSAQEVGHYEGGKIRVENDAGWTVGWVDAGHWTAS